MRPSLRWVLLRHDEPDGAWHYDWLLERSAPGPSPSPDDRDLIAFRVWSRPDDPAARAFDARRLPDHRRLYLTFEGPLSGGRGSVSRVFEGRCLVAAESDRALRVALLSPESGFERVQRVWIGSRVDPRPEEAIPEWRFALAGGG